MFYFLKYHLKRFCIYMDDATTVVKNILENAHLKLPSEPVCKLLKKSANFFMLALRFCPPPTLLLTWTIYLPDS